MTPLDCRRSTFSAPAGHGLSRRLAPRLLCTFVVGALSLAQASTARAQRAAILTDLGGPATPATALVGTPDLLYVAHGAEVRTYGFLTPERLQWREAVAPIPLPAPAARLVAAGRWLAAADEAGGLTLVDIGDAAAPQVGGTVDLGSGPPRDLVIDGDRVVAIDADGRVVVVAANPLRPPVVVSRFTASLGLRQVAVDGNRLYATAIDGRKQLYGPETLVLVIIDWSELGSPRELAATPLAGAAGYDSLWPRGIRTSGGKVLLFYDAFSWSPLFGMTRGTYLVVDASDPKAVKVELGTCQDATGAFLPPSSIDDVGRASGLPNAVFRVDERALQHVDLSDPLHPLFGPSVALVDQPLRDVTVAGARIFALDAHGTLVAVNFSDPGALSATTSDVTPPRAAAVAVDGGFAYVAFDRAGLGVYDLADPARPRRIGWLDRFDSSPRDVAIVSGIAYLAEAEAGLGLVDVRDPALPRRLEGLKTFGRVQRIVTQEGLTVIADGPNGVALVDSTRAEAPRVHAWLKLPDTDVIDVALDGGRAFGLTMDKGLAVIDVTGPSAPRLLSLESGITGWHIAVADGVLYVNDDGRLRLFDTRTLAPLGTFPVRDIDCCFHAFSSMTVANGFVYGVSEAQGLEVLDVRDPARITLAAQLPLPGLPRGVALRGEHVYSADWHWGLRVARAAVGAAVHGAFLPAVARYNPDNAVRPMTAGGEWRYIVGAVQPALSPDGRTLVAVTDSRFAEAPWLRLIDLLTGNEQYIQPPPGVTAIETATFDAEGRSIIFAGRHARWDVYRYWLADQRTDNITAGLFRLRSQQRRPSLAPDGQRLAFDRADEDASGAAGAEDIVVMDLVTRAVRRVTDHPAVDRFPSFAPDGRRLVFRSERDGQSDLYAVNVDGSDLERLTDDPAYEGYPSFSPDGRRVVFQSARSGRDQVWLLDLASRTCIPLTDSALSVREPRFEPGGQWIVAAAPDAYHDPTTGRWHAQLFEVDVPVWMRFSYSLRLRDRAEEDDRRLRPHQAHARLHQSRLLPGALLEDPEGLLEGSGKRLGHVKIRSLAEANRPSVRALVAAALAERRKGASGPARADPRRSTERCPPGPKAWRHA